MLYANIITNEGPKDSLPKRILIGGVDAHSPTLQQCYAAGWRRLIERAPVPADHTVTGRSFTQDPSEQYNAVEHLVTRPTSEIESDALDALAEMPDGVNEAFRAVIEQVEADKTVTRSILAVMLTKAVITQGQHDTAMEQIPGMTAAAYQTRWRELLEELP